MFKLIYVATKANFTKKGEVLTFPTQRAAEHYVHFYHMNHSAYNVEVATVK
jgi:hypothetical protein